jgi:tetratricopeptide (TPR) repeat protein
MKGILTMLAIMVALCAAAQSKPAKVPTTKEMEAMKRQMQEQLNKLTPEQRKMMEEMGVQLPDMNEIDEAAAIARSNPQARPGGLPKPNAAKVASVAPAPGPAALPAFVARLHKSVQAKLPTAQVAQARQLMAALQAETADAGQAGKAVVGLWLSGRPEMAVLLAGEVCTKDAGYAENINNYAAILNMMDAQQVALPLLQCLNKQYPGNATILANMGQAWFGMGDIKKAEQYLDSAIRRFPKHSQANFTKSQIQESKGDKAGAAESLKRSMETGFTEEKATARRRLGFSDNGDIAWPLHIPQDPLGFHKFQWPAFPKNVDESEALRKEWNDFHQQMRAISDAYKAKSDALEKQVEQAGQQKMDQYLRAMKAGTLDLSAGPLSVRAGRKLTYLLDDKDGGLTWQLEEATEDLMNLKKRVAVFDSAKMKTLKQLEKLECFAGEGSTATDREKCCQITDEANTLWMASSNALIKETYTKAVDVYKRLWSAQAYFYQYTMDELSFEMYKAQFKSTFASTMATCAPNFASPSIACKKENENPFKKKGLQDYDDINCNYHSQLDLKVMTITTDCSKMTTKVDAGKLKFQFTEDLNKSNGIIPNAITHGSVDVSVSLGSKGIGKWGPVKAEVGAGVDLNIEFTSQGISEVSATVGANVDVGTDMFDNAGSIAGAVNKGGAAYMKESGQTVLLPGVGDKSATIGGVAGTITINSGSGVVGSGALSGLKL